MKCKIWLLAIWLICLSGWMTSCGGGHNVVEPPPSSLPELVLPWPDSLGQPLVSPHITSADNHRINLTVTGDAYLAKSDNTVPGTNHLRLMAGTQEVSWGMYGFEDIVTGSAPFRIGIELFGWPMRYYLGIADYQQQVWQWISVDASTGEDYYDIPPQWQPVSSDGGLYIAVVAWNGQSLTLTHLTLNLAVVSPVHGLAFGPYLSGLNPRDGDVVSLWQISNLLESTAPYCEGVRIHAATQGLEHVPQRAKELGLSVAAACWLDRNFTTNDAEVLSLIELAKGGNVDIIIVGTETLQRNDLSQSELIGYIQQVRTAMDAAGLEDIPITTNDTWYQLVHHPGVMDVCDIILANFYPYWEGVSVDNAVKSLHYHYQNLCYVVGDKEVIIGEVGWPSDGDPEGEAIPSLENAALFWLNFTSWAQAENVKYFYFEAYDEAWKKDYEPNDVGDHWGIRDETGLLKPGMMKVFNGETMADNWSYIDSGGAKTIEFTYVPPIGSDDNLVGMVYEVNPLDYKVAVYIYVPDDPEYPNAEGWWTKPRWTLPLTSISWDNTWVCDITTGGVDKTATQIAAYVVLRDYEPPLCYGNSNLPVVELEANSVAHTEVARP